MKVLLSVFDHSAKYSGHEFWMGYVGPGKKLVKNPATALVFESRAAARAAWEDDWETWAIQAGPSVWPEYRTPEGCRV